MAWKRRTSCRGEDEFIEVGVYGHGARAYADISTNWELFATVGQLRKISKDCADAADELKRRRSTDGKA